MFDKNKFAQIIKNIKETYNSQEEFSKNSSIGRTYLSQYMNMKLDEPPKPKILKKLANSSNGLITYEELMSICGYINENDFNTYLLAMLGFTSNDVVQFNEAIDTLNMTDFEKNLFYSLVSELQSNILSGNNKLPFDIKEILKKYNPITRDKIASAFKIYEIYLQKMVDYSNVIISHRKQSTNNTSMFMIPILGKIAAGQPILAEEYLEGYLPVDPNIYGMTTPDDYFYLKVSGESMNLKVHNGDYALIHKQDYADDGDIIVAIVNGDDEATLKKYKIINESTIALEPMSTLPMEPIYVNLKDTNFKIIGKAIGQFGKF